MATERMRKVAEAIREEAAKILEHELKDPRVGFVTVTRVEVSADLEHAVIYYSLLEGEPRAPRGTGAAGPAGAEATRAGLKRAEGYVRRLLGERLRLRVTPEVRFEEDPSVAESIRISKLLRREEESGEKAV